MKLTHAGLCQPSDEGSCESFLPYVWLWLQVKQEPWFTFNPGLALTGFQTTGPRRFRPAEKIFRRNDPLGALVTMGYEYDLDAVFFLLMMAD